jgi:hypothetical protein
MADLWVTVGFVAFFGVIAGLMGLTYFAFTRMDKDVRRARMFIMEKRIERFIGAFAFAFIAFTVWILIASIGVAPAAVAGPLASAVIVFWLGAMGYGTFELYLIVRPPKGALLRARNLFAAANRGARGDRSIRREGAGSERDATK